MPAYQQSIRLVVCLGLLALGVGCADGPIPELRTYNPWVREQWAEDEKFGPTYYTRVEALQNLRNRASSMSPDERERVSAELAQQISAESSVPMQREMIRTLAVYRTTTAEAAILTTLKSDSADVRRYACEALAQQGSPAAITTLGEVVGSDTDPDVRKAAARALQSYPDPAAAQALRVALDEDDPAMQKIAMDSLRQISGRDYGNDPSRWREYLQGGDPTPAPPPSIASTLTDWIWW